MLTTLNALHRQGQINNQEPRSLFEPAEIFNTRWLLRALLVEWRQGRVPALTSLAPAPTRGTCYTDVPIRLPASNSRNLRLDLSDPEPVAELHAIAGQILLNRSKREVKLASNFSQVVVFEVMQGSRTATVPFWRKVTWLADLLWYSRRWGNYQARYIVLRPRQRQVDPAQFDTNTIYQLAERWRFDNQVLVDRLSQASNLSYTWRDILVGIPINQLAWEDVLVGPNTGDLREFYARCLEFAPRG